MLLWRIRGEVAFVLRCACPHCAGHAYPTRVIEFLLEALTADEAIARVLHEPSRDDWGAAHKAIMALTDALGMAGVKEWEWEDDPTVDPLSEDQALRLRGAAELPGLGSPPKGGRFVFTANLVRLMEEGARLLTQSDQAQAGIGLIMGYRLSLAHLGEITKIAEELADPRLLLWLFALGVVTESPVAFCRERGTWGLEHEPLAQQLGAL